MPWELRKVEDKRKELIEAYVSGTPMSELCREHGVSRKTAYKWFNRSLQYGLEEGLKDLSRAPHEPVRIYSACQIQRAIDLKRRKLRWGPKKILAILQDQYPSEVWPCETRLYEIFKEYGLVLPRKLRNRVPATHPLGDINDCNDAWTVDHKGWWQTRDGRKCEPLTLLDGHSRFSLSCNHTARKSCEYVWPLLEIAFKEYGLPNRLRHDNGAPFGSIGVGRLSPLSILIIKAGVIPEWINPGHPEENGRHERFHSTLKQAVASPPARNLKEQIARMKAFQEEYNYERPHEALGQEPPARHYYASPRKWDGILRPPEYNTREMKVRKVCPSGCLWLNQEEYYIGSALTGEYVGMREMDEGLEAYYGPVYLGLLRPGKKKLERPKLNPKKIVRRKP
jgi:transposase InsO family protein